MPCAHKSSNYIYKSYRMFLFYSSETDEEEDFSHNKMQKSKGNLTHTCGKDPQSRKWQHSSVVSMA